MTAHNRFFLPAGIVTLLVVLLALIGWLAFHFFGLVAQQVIPIEPKVLVSTSGVERIMQPAPVSQEEILFPEQQTESESGQARNQQPEPVARHAQVPTHTPLVCAGYGPDIRNRDAWPQPLRFTTSISPTRVVITIQPPLEENP